MASLRNTSLPHLTGAGIANLQPSLHMADGGMFSGLRRAIGLKEDSPELKAYKARAAAEREAAKNPPKPAAPAPAPTNPLGSQSVIDARMKAAGAKNGGELRMTEGVGGPVPGKGSGDKIPAKYEPGEFVVSNDMLDAAPSLRDELHSLRTQVLAEKGMTPQEADAKAVSGGTLRANSGYEVDEYGIPTKPRQAGMGAAPSLAQSPSQNNGSASVSSSGVGGLQERSTGSVTDGFLPSLRQAYTNVGRDIQSNVSKGNYPAAIGSATLGAAAQYGRAAADDLIASPLRTTNKLSRPVAGIVSNFAAGAAGTELAPETQKMFEAAAAPTLRQPEPAPYTPSSAAFNPATRVLRQGATPAAPGTDSGSETPSLRGVEGKQVGSTGAFRFDVPGRNPTYTDKASLADTERMVSRPTMSASDPGMMGIQARQDAADAGRANKAQYDAEVTNAQRLNEAGRRINLEYSARNGDRAAERQLRSEDKMAEAKLQSETSLRNAQTQADSYKYTADSSLRGDIYKTDGAARSARAAAERDAFYKDREFDASQGKQTFEQRQAARKAMDDRIATKFVDKEGKPDLMRAADFKDSVSVTLGALAAEARAKGDVNRAEKLAKADYSNLDSEDEAMIQQLFDAKEAARQNAGFFNGKFVDDKNLLSFRPNGVRQNSVMSNNVRTQNGSELNMHDARRQGIFGGPGSSNLDPYLSEAQRLRGTQGR